MIQHLKSMRHYSLFKNINCNLRIENSSQLTLVYVCFQHLIIYILIEIANSLNLPTTSPISQISSTR